MPYDINFAKLETTEATKMDYTLCSEKNTHSHFLSYLHEYVSI